MALKGISRGYRSAKRPNVYRKLSDRIKPTSKGGFLQMGTISHPEYDDEGNMVSWDVQDLSEVKKVKALKRRRHRKRSAKKPRVYRRRNYLDCNR